jgi:hypothetical protein
MMPFISGRLAISIRLLREANRWRVLADFDGQPLFAWEDFCQYPEPRGLALSPEQIEVIMDRANAKRRMVELLGWGGDRKSEQARKDQGAAAP